MNKKGFTLMELLIVVVIITGFAAMTYPAYKSSIERARASEAVTMLGAIQAAQQKHFVNYESYGTTFRDINDFEPAIKDFDASQSSFFTDYFKYELSSDDSKNRVTATRVDSNHAPLNKGYNLVAFYDDSFIRCNVTNDEGDKVCSSLTDKEKIENHYRIF